MKELFYNLDKSHTRPLVSIDGMDALIDTGADIPLCSNKDILVDRYNARKLMHISSGPLGITGPIVGDIYEIPLFNFGELMYPRLKIIVPNKAVFHSHFILSASMFYGLLLEFDFINHKMKISVPEGQQLIRNAQFDKAGEHFIMQNQL